MVHAQLNKIELDDTLIRYWTTQKYEYYLAARTLWLGNQMQMGALMYAYAIESQLKCALIMFENQCPKGLIESKHDIPRLFEEAKKAGLFLDVFVSNDFIEFVQDGFDRRYPSQTMKRAKIAREDGRFLILIPDMCNYYDRLVIDLDKSLTNIANDFKVSICLAAVKDSEGAGVNFFKDNSYAFQNIDYIQKLIRQEIDHFSCISNIEGDYQCHISLLNNKLSVLYNLEKTALNPVLHARYINTNIDLRTLVHPGRPM